MEKIIVGIINHKYGVNFYASRTYEGLIKEVADFCREWWDDFASLAGTEIPQDDQEVINEYFDENNAGGWESFMYDDTNLN